jgi:hypothetical protein
MGLLDNLMGTSVDDPRFAATTQLAQGLLSSPRLMQGLAQGLGGYQQAMAQAKQQKAAEEYRAMQIAHVRAQMDAQQRKQAQSELDARLTRQAFTGVKPIEANAASGITGPRPEALAAVGKMPAFDPAAFIASGGSLELATSLQKALTKTGPEYSPTVQYDQDGRAFLVAKDGTHKYIDNVRARDKLITEDLGGKKILRTEYSPEARGQYGKTETPDALLSASTTRRGQNMTKAAADEANDINRQAARTQVVIDPQRGPILIDKGTAIARPALGVDGKPVPGQEQVASSKRVGQLRAGIQQARELLLADPTGSYAGAAIDQGARAFGMSTEGGRLASRLETIGGWLVANVPRMEGPQSNIDVENYKTMAARVGDRTLPVRERLEALDELETLQDKYDELNGGTPRPATPRPANPRPGPNTRLKDIQAEADAILGLGG